MIKTFFFPQYLRNHYFPFFLFQQWRYVFNCFILFCFVLVTYIQKNTDYKQLLVYPISDQATIFIHTVFFKWKRHVFLKIFIHNFFLYLFLFSCIWEDRESLPSLLNPSMPSLLLSSPFLSLVLHCRKDTMLFIREVPLTVCHNSAFTFAQHVSWSDD